MIDPITRRNALFLSMLVGGFGAARAAQAARGPLPETMRAGFNLPDQAPMRADHVARQETLRALRQIGMTHVRLPVAAEYVLSPFSGPATISQTLDDLDRAVERLLGLGYAVSVDLHPENDFSALQRRDPANAHRLLLAGWPAIAQRLNRWPSERVFVELLNEPATTDDIWRPFVERLAQAVRAVLPANYLVVGPAPFQRIDALTNWTPLADKKIVYACHYYDPMMFTHQGASWDTAPWGRASDVPFPTEANDARLLSIAQRAQDAGDAPLAGELRTMARAAWNAQTIAAQFAELGRWAARHDALVVINEFGVLKWRARRADRLAWLVATRQAAEAQGFGWAHWDYSTSFGLLDDAGAIDQGLLLALLAKPSALGASARSVAPSVRATSPMTTGSESGTK